MILTPTAQNILVCRKSFVGLVNLRGDHRIPAFTRSVSTVLRLDLPSVPNTTNEGSDTVACWLGPTEWLIVLPVGRECPVAAGLRDALAGQFASVVEVGGGQMVLLLTGSCVRDVLAKGCPLDLREGAFGTGQCAQSRLASVPVLLRPVGMGVELILPRSYADHLWQWLDLATQEYGGMAVPPDGPEMPSVQRARKDVNDVYVKAG